MAMFENEGFCPNNSFYHYGMEGKHKISDAWEKNCDILGDRLGYMVYTEAGCAYKGCYVVDCLMGESDIALEIAITLKTLIPECKYAEIGRKILITDVINPYQIPGISGGYDKFETVDKKMQLFEDARYLCGVADEGEHVRMYFYKKE